MAVNTPHFSYPFAFDANGRSVVVEQDSPGDLIARAANVCVCEEGFREDNPEFGIPPILFGQTPLPVQSMQAAVERWAEIDCTVSDGATALEAATRAVTVGV